MNNNNQNPFRTLHINNNKYQMNIYQMNNNNPNHFNNFPNNNDKNQNNINLKQINGQYLKE